MQRSLAVPPQQRARDGQVGEPVLVITLCEEHECESNDESGKRVIACADDVASVDRNLAVGWLGRNNSAVAAG